MKEHHQIVQDMNNLKGYAKEVMKQLDSIEDNIKQMAEKMDNKNMRSSLVEDCQIQIFKGACIG